MGSLGARHERVRLQNIRIAIAARRHHFDNRVGVPFLCECDDGSCREFVVTTLPEFEHVKRKGLVLVAPDHHVAPAPKSAIG